MHDQFSGHHPGPDLKHCATEGAAQTRDQMPASCHLEHPLPHGLHFCPAGNSTGSTGVVMQGNGYHQDHHPGGVLHPQFAPPPGTCAGADGPEHPPTNEGRDRGGSFSSQTSRSSSTSSSPSSRDDTSAAVRHHHHHHHHHHGDELAGPALLPPMMPEGSASGHPSGDGSMYYARHPHSQQQQLLPLGSDSFAAARHNALYPFAQPPPPSMLNNQPFPPFAHAPPPIGDLSRSCYPGLFPCRTVRPPGPGGRFLVEGAAPPHLGDEALPTFPNAAAAPNRLPAHKPVRLAQPKHPLAPPGIPVYFKYGEEHYPEETVPPEYTFTETDGTVCRYITNFLVYNKRGERLLPIEVLDQPRHAALVLYGSLLPATAMSQGARDADTLRGRKRTAPPPPTAAAKRQNVGRRKGDNDTQVRWPSDHRGSGTQTYPVRVELAEWCIDYGQEPSNVPFIWLISRWDVYYRLEKPAGRYISTFATAKMKFEVATRVIKTLQYRPDTPYKTLVDLLTAATRLERSQRRAERRAQRRAILDGIKNEDDRCKEEESTKDEEDSKGLGGQVNDGSATAAGGTTKKKNRNWRIQSLSTPQGTGVVITDEAGRPQAVTPWGAPYAVDGCKESMLLGLAEFLESQLRNFLDGVGAGAAMGDGVPGCPNLLNAPFMRTLRERTALRMETIQLMEAKRRALEVAKSLAEAASASGLPPGSGRPPTPPVDQGPVGPPFMTGYPGAPNGYPPRPAGPYFPHQDPAPHPPGTQPHHPYYGAPPPGGMGLLPHQAATLPGTGMTPGDSITALEQEIQHLQQLLKDSDEDEEDDEDSPSDHQHSSRGGSFSEEEDEGGGSHRHVPNSLRSSLDPTTAGGESAASAGMYRDYGPIGGKQGFHGPPNSPCEGEDDDDEEEDDDESASLAGRPLTNGSPVRWRQRRRYHSHFGGQVLDFSADSVEEDAVPTSWGGQESTSMSGGSQWDRTGANKDAAIPSHPSRTPSSHRVSGVPLFASGTGPPPPTAPHYAAAFHPFFLGHHHYPHGPRVLVDTKTACLPGTMVHPGTAAAAAALLQQTRGRVHPYDMSHFLVSPQDANDRILCGVGAGGPMSQAVPPQGGGGALVRRSRDPVNVDATATADVPKKNVPKTVPNPSSASADEADGPKRTAARKMSSGAREPTTSKRKRSSARLSPERLPPVNVALPPVPRDVVDDLDIPPASLKYYRRPLELKGFRPWRHPSLLVIADFVDKLGEWVFPSHSKHPEHSGALLCSCLASCRTLGGLLGLDDEDPSVTPTTINILMAALLRLLCRRFERLRPVEVNTALAAAHAAFLEDFTAAPSSSSACETPALDDGSNGTTETGKAETRTKAEESTTTYCLPFHSWVPASITSKQAPQVLTTYGWANASMNYAPLEVVVSQPTLRVIAGIIVNSQGAGARRDDDDGATTPPASLFHSAVQLYSHGKGYVSRRPSALGLGLVSGIHWWKDEGSIDEVTWELYLRVVLWECFCAIRPDDLKQRRLHTERSRKTRRSRPEATNRTDAAGPRKEPAAAAASSEPDQCRKEEADSVSHTSPTVVDSAPMGGDGSQHAVGAVEDSRSPGSRPLTFEDEQSMSCVASPCLPHILHQPERSEGVGTPECPMSVEMLASSSQQDPVPSGGLPHGASPSMIDDDSQPPLSGARQVGGDEEEEEEAPGSSSAEEEDEEEATESQEDVRWNWDIDTTKARSSGLTSPKDIQRMRALIESQLGVATQTTADNGTPADDTEMRTVADSNLGGWASALAPTDRLFLLHWLVTLLARCPLGRDMAERRMEVAHAIRTAVVARSKEKQTPAEIPNTGDADNTGGDAAAPAVGCPKDALLTVLDAIQRRYNMRRECLGEDRFLNRYFYFEEHGRGVLFTEWHVLVPMQRDTASSDDGTLRVVEVETRTLPPGVPSYTDINYKPQAGQSEVAVPSSGKRKQSSSRPRRKPSAAAVEAPEGPKPDASQEATASLTTNDPMHEPVPDPAAADATPPTKQQEGEQERTEPIAGATGSADTTVSVVNDSGGSLGARRSARTTKGKRKPPLDISGPASSSSTQEAGGEGQASSATQPKKKVPYILATFLGHGEREWDGGVFVRRPTNGSVYLAMESFDDGPDGTCQTFAKKTQSERDRVLLYTGRFRPLDWQVPEKTRKHRSSVPPPEELVPKESVSPGSTSQYIPVVQWAYTSDVEAVRQLVDSLSLSTTRERHLKHRLGQLLDSRTFRGEQDGDGGPETRTIADPSVVSASGCHGLQQISARIAACLREMVDFKRYVLDLCVDRRRGYDWAPFTALMHSMEEYWGQRGEAKLVDSLEDAVALLRALLVTQLIFVRIARAAPSISKCPTAVPTSGWNFRSSPAQWDNEVKALCWILGSVSSLHGGVDATVRAVTVASALTGANTPSPAGVIYDLAALVGLYFRLWCRFNLNRVAVEHLISTATSIPPPPSFLSANSSPCVDIPIGSRRRFCRAAYMSQLQALKASGVSLAEEVVPPPDTDRLLVTVAHVWYHYVRHRDLTLKGAPHQKKRTSSTPAAGGTATCPTGGSNTATSPPSSEGFESYARIEVIPEQAFDDDADEQEPKSFMICVSFRHISSCLVNTDDNNNDNDELSDS